MKAPGRERIAESEAHDGRGEDHAHHHAHRQREIAGAFEHEERHGQWRADHRCRHRGHADHHQRGMLRHELGHQIGRQVGEHRAQQAAEEQRGAEHAAAETRAQRECRSQQLGAQQGQQQRQAESAVERELDGTVPAAQHLRDEPGEAAHQQAAHRRAKPLRQRRAAHPALDPGHCLHGKHAEAGGQDAEHGEQQVEPLAERRDVADDEQRVGVPQCAQRQGAGERRRRHRRQRPHAIASEDQLVGIEGAGQRRIEGCRDGRGRSGADEDPLVEAAQLEVLADLGQQSGAELGIARLHADGDAGGVRDDRRDEQAQAVDHRHASAMQGIGLDRVDDLVRPKASHDERGHAEHEAADQRDDEDTVRVDADAAAERVVRGEAKREGMQEVDEPVRAADQGADHHAERRADHDLRRFVGAQPALHAEKPPCLPQDHGAGPFPGRPAGRLSWGSSCRDRQRQRPFRSNIGSGQASSFVTLQGNLAA